jgi:hypothetical protein
MAAEILKRVDEQDLCAGFLLAEGEGRAMPESW